MVICLERGADLHMAQLMPLPLTVSCSSKIQIGFTFLVPTHLGSPGKKPLNGCVCVSGVKSFSALTSGNQKPLTHKFYFGRSGEKPEGELANTASKTAVILQWC